MSDKKLNLRVRAKSSSSLLNAFSGSAVSNIVNMGSLVGGEHEFAERVADNVYFMDEHELHDPRSLDQGRVRMLNKVSKRRYNPLALAPLNMQRAKSSV